jgi:hypothetical protein
MRIAQDDVSFAKLKRRKIKKSQGCTGMRGRTLKADERQMKIVDMLSAKKEKPPSTGSGASPLLLPLRPTPAIAQALKPALGSLSASSD